eukprot:9253850-Pyramimonas_sp.AAC.1
MPTSSYGAAAAAAAAGCGGAGCGPPPAAPAPAAAAAAAFGPKCLGDGPGRIGSFSDLCVSGPPLAEGAGPQ